MFTQLEDLPNELLIDTFGYFDIRELFYSFWKLNKRFKQLIRSLQNLSLTLEKDEPKLISLFACQIRQLVVNTRQDINFNQFPRLYSLVLHQMTPNQWKQLGSAFLPHLTYLSTSCITEYSYEGLLLHIRILFSNQLPTLRHLNLGFIHAPVFRWTESSSLYSISVRSNDPTVVPYILTSCHNLYYLDVSFLPDTVENCKNQSVITNHPLKQFILSDSYHKLSFEIVDIFLSSIPNVKRIKLSFQCNVPFIDFVQCLSNRLRYLRRFDCEIDDISDDETTTIEIIRQIHPCFNRIQLDRGLHGFRTFRTY
ncbi:unnamed protein product [Rotaria sp. Silwood1]|nr:unnamed protein product [Rotaria sp. Silwood1]